MLASALRDGSAGRHCVFELFARRLPDGRRYGVVAGTARLLEALESFRFGPDELAALAAAGLDGPTLEVLASWRFTGDVDGYPEGELYFPGSPVVTAAGDRPLIEMGSRRTQEEAAVAAARAAYLAGFAATSNLEAGRRHGIPTTGTAAHSFTLLHDSEAAAFKAQVDTLGVGTTL